MNNLSLVIKKVPEPSISGGLSVGVSLLILLKLRRTRQVLQ
ncbi:PEP-CTERM sorting domain-containing protein [Nostoc sp. CENA67]|uniref:PEP-CTERM sorting domain-containing protein n=1 Tax=Amazonocrinis nigriterrae CENA67 TaxID=2794033 RepID=A0A8J7L8R1_9NOST|nr:PEP-CTERM sorting domain-containing protein [Amazonocrinis nigriterrae]MBH8564724.1 PEP-CTERM sorting domain-containing protein [Amazonocrinis nigriterrae CENA67]